MQRLMLLIRAIHRFARDHRAVYAITTLIAVLGLSAVAVGLVWWLWANSAG